ncbi:MAG: undecaprenyl-diphosphatase UppP [Thermoflexales bacterium]|nr:undecaprenyl-diphosphatase UppP [Thermoflexales bacterium]
MNLIQAIILGLVQGVTEYIPVSSSAHLVLVPWLLGWQDASFEFEVLVQWGTLVGVIIYFWRDLWDIVREVLLGLWRRKPLATFEARLGWYIVLATLPAVVFGLALKESFETAYSSPVAVAALLLGTAAILTVAEYFGQRARELANITWLDALVIGFWQVAALLPGVSRSGATISGGILRGLDRPSAARFSFLMSIPPMLGAGVLAIKDLLEAGQVGAQMPAITVGFVAAAISGYACIRWLMGYLQRGRLYGFAIYCAVVGVGCLAKAML